MKKGQGFSLTILLICILCSIQFEAIVSQSSRLVAENYKRSNQIFFNLNNDFEYRAQIFTMDEAYVIVGRTSVQYISQEGKLKWEKDISSPNVSVARGNNQMILAEKKAGDIFIINKNGDIVEKRYALGAIESIKSYEDEYVGVLKSNHDFVLLDKNLKTICSTTLPKGTVIDYEVDLTSQTIAIAVLDLSRQAYNTKLVLTSFNGSIVGGSNLEKQIAYDMALHNGKIYVLTDMGISCFTFDGKLQDRYKVNQTISQFSLSENTWLYLIVDKIENTNVATQKNKMIQVGANNKIITEFKSPIDSVNGMMEISDGILMFNEEKVVLLNNEGKLLETYKGTEVIRAVHVVNKKSFAIEYMNHLDIFILK